MLCYDTNKLLIVKSCYATLEQFVIAALLRLELQSQPAPEVRMRQGERFHVQQVRPAVPAQAELRLPPKAETQDRVRDYRSVRELGAGGVPGEQPARPAELISASAGPAGLLSQNEGDVSDPASSTGVRQGTALYTVRSGRDVGLTAWLSCSTVINGNGKGLANMTRSAQGRNLELPERRAAETSTHAPILGHLQPLAKRGYFRVLVVFKPLTKASLQSQYQC